MEGIAERIYNQKINEIQARLPVKLFPDKDDSNFAQVLSENINKSPSNTSSKSISSLGYSSNSIGLTGSSFDNLIKDASEKYGVDSSLIEAVIKAESGFNPSAVSPAGALGLMQLMPSTAAGLGVKNALDPAQNINGGTLYLKQLLDRYNGDVKMALAAYNSGSGTLKNKGITNLNSESEMNKLYAETRNYVNKIMNYMSLE